MSPWVIDIGRGIQRYTGIDIGLDTDMHIDMKINVTLLRRPLRPFSQNCRRSGDPCSLLGVLGFGRSPAEGAPIYPMPCRLALRY